MQNIYGYTLTQLQQIIQKHNYPSYVALQIAQWIYSKHTHDFQQMTNLSHKQRTTLSQNYNIIAEKPISYQTSKDKTKKYLYQFPTGKVETAWIPDKDRSTICLSCQVGCKRACSFCMTARQGWQNNLTSGQILAQYASLPEREQITNFVYMGMGEPMDNLENVLHSLEILTSEYGYYQSNSRITVSTIGIIPSMIPFLEQTKCRFAISLHSPFQEQRDKIVPGAKQYPLTELFQTLKKYTFDEHRRLTFEYIVWENINHSQEHVEQLYYWMKDLNCRLNLIHYHSIPNQPFPSASTKTLLNFQSQLQKKGISTTIRKSRGQDINAACGLLSTLDKRSHE
ncbi:MAG TPA: 23S rRNA (adenine(2503)-C(2))-methyltransferase RlmN [Planctomycetota bacterium]|nr:23S rRNA (adenine(2503)-C(2))-methyltransferase RlmN [Planctomycetota bacterium]HRU52139.1 23S rRNA (adenine(2503)-C(2))-methyltransferase RlmN [Planctomycetota bacterium]